MRVALVGSEVEENLSLRYLASALRRAGHRAAIVPFGCREDMDHALAVLSDMKPDLIGLSMVFQKRAMEFMELASRLREEGYRGHITCGGHFPTFSYSEIMTGCKGIDSAVRHEGEEAIVELACALEEGRTLSGIRGLVFRSHENEENSSADEEKDGSGSILQNAPRPPSENLDLLDFPARDFAPKLHLGIPTAPLVGSRGCYGDCSFCCINAWHKTSGGKKYRRRSPSNIAEEMEQLYHGRGVRIFIFHDDNFFTADRHDNMRRAAELKRELISRGLGEARLVVKARPDNVERELFSFLKDMGLLRVYLGIENNSPGGLSALNRKVRPEDNERAISILRELDIFTCYNILLFDPSTGPDDIENNMAFMERYNFYPYNFCRTEVYVASELQFRLKAEGRLLGDYLSSDYVIRDPRIETLFRIVASAFYERNFTPDGLANANMGLGYSKSLLKAFYRKACPDGLEKRAQALISEINDTGLEFLREAFYFVIGKKSRTIRDVQSFTAELAFRMIASNHRLLRSLESLELEIAERAYYSKFPDQPAGNRAVRKGNSVVRYAASIPACLALTIMNSGCIPQVCDPVPPPHVTNSATVSPSGSDNAPTPPAVDPVPPPSPPSRLPDNPSPQAKASLILTRGRYDLGPMVSSIEGSAALTDSAIKIKKRPSVTASSGEIADTVISPDSRHISFRYSAAKSQAPGPVTITAVFPTLVKADNSGDINDITATGKLYVYEDGRMSIGETPLPKEQRGMVVDFAPPPSTIVDSTSSVGIECTMPDNPVVDEKGGIATYGLGTSSLEFTVRLKDSVKGTVGKPEVSATLGTVSALSAAGREGNFTFLFTLPSAEGVLKKGTAVIRVRIPVEYGGKSHRFENSVKITIRDDGTVTIPAKGTRSGRSSRDGRSPASLPRSIHGSIEKLMGTGELIVLKMSYCYTGAAEGSCLTEKLAPNQWRGHDGVTVTWEAKTGSVSVRHDGTVEWLPAGTGDRQWISCTCTGPDGSVWARSICCSGLQT